MYTGCFTDDYKVMYGKDPEETSKIALVGITPSMLSGRISWFYDFKGPSMTIDTACSSSLVALDLGCQSLLSRNAAMVRHNFMFAHILTDFRVSLLGAI